MSLCREVRAGRGGREREGRGEGGQAKQGSGTGKHLLWRAFAQGQCRTGQNGGGGAAKCAVAVGRARAGRGVGLARSLRVHTAGAAMGAGTGIRTFQGGAKRVSVQRRWLGRLKVKVAHHRVEGADSEEREGGGGAGGRSWQWWFRAGVVGVGGVKGSPVERTGSTKLHPGARQDTYGEKCGEGTTHHLSLLPLPTMGVPIRQSRPTPTGPLSRGASPCLREPLGQGGAEGRACNVMHPGESNLRVIHQEGTHCTLHTAHWPDAPECSQYSAKRLGPRRPTRLGMTCQA